MCDFSTEFGFWLWNSSRVLYEIAFHVKFMKMWKCLTAVFEKRLVEVLCQHRKLPHVVKLFESRKGRVKCLLGEKSGAICNLLGNCLLLLLKGEWKAVYGETIYRDFNLFMVIMRFGCCCGWRTREANNRENLMKCFWFRWMQLFG